MVFMRVGRARHSGIAARPLGRGYDAFLFCPAPAVFRWKAFYPQHATYGVPDRAAAEARARFPVSKAVL